MSHGSTVFRNIRRPRMVAKKLGRLMDGEWDSYAPPSQFANSPQEAHEMIKNGDFWTFDQVGFGKHGDVISVPRAANASDWAGLERAQHSAYADEEPASVSPGFICPKIISVIFGWFAGKTPLMQTVSLYEKNSRSSEWEFFFNISIPAVVAPK